MNPGNAIWGRMRREGVLEVCSLPGTVFIIHSRETLTCSGSLEGQGSRKGEGAEKGLLEGLPPIQTPESMWHRRVWQEAQVKEMGF